MCLQDFPTDMPISGRGLLRNKDGKMKAYMSKLNNIKILPAASAEDSTSYVDLLVEEERVPVPYVQKSQIEKIQLDKGKIERYLDVLALEERPSTIKLDQSKIFGYIMELASTQGPEQLVFYKPRIKLLKAASQGSMGRDGETFHNGKGTLRLPRDTQPQSEEVEEVSEGQPLGGGGSKGRPSEEDGCYVFEEYDEPRGKEKNDCLSGYEGDGKSAHSDGLYRAGRDISQHLDGDAKSKEGIQPLSEKTKEISSGNDEVSLKDKVNFRYDASREIDTLRPNFIESRNIETSEDSAEDDKTGFLANLNNELSNLPSNNIVPQNISEFTGTTNALNVNRINPSPTITNVNEKKNIQVNNPNIVNPAKPNDMAVPPTKENLQLINPGSHNISMTSEKNLKVANENDVGLRSLIRSGKNISNDFQPSTVTNDYHVEAHTEIISKPSQNIQNPLYNKSSPSNAVKNFINITADLNGSQSVSNASSMEEEKLIAHEAVTTQSSNIGFNSLPLDSLDPLGTHSNTKLTANISNVQNVIISKPSNKSQDEPPNMYNTVLDLMGLTPNKLFENPFPANMSSLSIHIFGPDVTKSLSNESWPNNLLSKLQEIIIPNPNEALSIPSINQDTFQNHTKVESSSNDIASNVVKDSFNKFSTVVPQISGRIEGESNSFDQSAVKLDVTSTATIAAVPPAGINPAVLENPSPQTQNQANTRPEPILENKNNESSCSDSRRLDEERLIVKNRETLANKDLDPLKPTKPPEMFDSYYNFIRREIMRHKNADDSKIDATNEHELYKVVFQNLEGINPDKGSLFKIIGRAVENDRLNNPPKWVEERKEEAELASHMGQRTDSGPQVRGEVGPVYPQGMLKTMVREVPSKKRSVTTPRAANAKPRKKSNTKQNPDILFPLKT